jgi:hypothetical protein
MPSYGPLLVNAEAFFAYLGAEIILSGMTYAKD